MPRIKTFRGMRQIKIGEPAQAQEEVVESAPEIKPVAFDWGNVTAKQTTYGGPDGYSDSSKLSAYAPALAAVAKAKGRVSDSKTEGGVSTQLQDMYGKSGPYTQGENLLDTQIAMTGEGKNLLEQSQNKWGQLDSWLKGSELSAQAKIQGAKDNVTNVNKQWENAGKAAQDKAIATNKYFADADNKRIEEENKKLAQDKIAKDKVAAREKAVKDKANEAMQSTAKAMNVMEQRKQYVKDKKSGAIKDGYLWTQSDYDHYMATGETPNKKQVNKYLAENGGII
jgi:hypothetical protein